MISDFKWRLHDWFPNLTDDQHKKLIIYRDELIKFNKHVNLISPATLPSLDLIHFSDSILGWKLISDRLKAEVFYDLGSGNGFPGLVAAALSPNARFILIDSDERKIEFIRHCAFKMSLQNISASSARVESIEYEPNSVAMSRGLSNIEGVCRLLNYVPNNFCLAHFKGRDFQQEIDSFSLSSWKFLDSDPYSLPETDHVRMIVYTQKV